MKKSNIDIAVIEGLSRLSQISFNDEQKEIMQAQVSGIIEMLDACAKVDKSATVSKVMKLSELREDVSESCVDAKDIIAGAPRVDNGYIVVPKVVD